MSRVIFLMTVATAGWLALTSVSQAMIFLSGAWAIWLTQQSNEQWKRYACLVGVVGQPFWVMETWQAEQDGMFIQSLVITFVWMQGLWIHWIKPRLEPVNAS